MKANELLSHFLKISRAWVDPARTVDRIITGDPEKEVRSVLVTWMSTLYAVKRAVEKGVDLLVTHEPTFFEHFDEVDKIDRFRIGTEKKKFIDDNGLVILRNHDCWDRMPEIGIPFAWAQFLGFGEPPVQVSEDRFQHRYDMEPVPVDRLASRIAAKCALFGEPQVQVIGHGSHTVSRIGIGTGCACNVAVFQELGCDLAVVSDDGSLYWRTFSRTVDEGYPVIRVNHATSEEPGMISLTRYMQKTFPDLAVEHLPHRCWYHCVSELRKGAET